MKTFKKFCGEINNCQRLVGIVMNKLLNELERRCEPDCQHDLPLKRSICRRQNLQRCAIMLSVAFAIIISGCRPAPFKVGAITSPPTQVASTDQSQVRNLEATVSASIAARYQQKKSPSFAIINGYYRLPEALPYGAAARVETYSYQTHFEATVVTPQNSHYAIVPMSGDDANGLQKAFNSLLDAGVKIKEISMADALAIAKAEQAAASHKDIFRPIKVLAPDVDYLMSIYPSTSPRGPVLIGRVIKKDGTLLAFRVVYRGVNNSMMGTLVISLFEDTIARI